MINKDVGTMLTLYKQCDKLATRLSELTFMLGNKGEFSPEVDRLLNEYDYSIENAHMDAFDGDYKKVISMYENFIERAENLIESYIKGTLTTKKSISVERVNIRKKKISKAKSKRKIVKKCKCNK